MINWENDDNDVATNIVKSSTQLWLVDDMISINKKIIVCLT